MKKTTTSRYDVADHLRTPEEMVGYVEAMFEEANGDAACIAKAFGDVARSNGQFRDEGLIRMDGRTMTIVNEQVLKKLLG